MDYAKEALRLHAKWNGKLETVPKMKIENKDEPVIDADPKYSNIKAIVLNNGKVIEGQIISINANVLKIRTKEDNISSYSFMNAKEYIKK